MEWISVKERLPKPSGIEDAPSVLISDGRYISVGWYEHNLEETGADGIVFPEEQLWHDEAHKLISDHNGWPEVSHWAPLPELPEYVEK